MKVIIGCIDGKTYESDDIDEAEVQAELDESKGQIGSGALSGVEINTVDEFCQFMSDMIEDEYRGMKTTNITLVIDGRDRNFKPETIVWHEIVRD